MTNPIATEKKIEDYLPYYLGCEVVFGFPDKKKRGVLVGKDERFGWQIFDTSRVLVHHHFVKTELINLILRPLSDMTEDEAIELAGLSEWPDHFRDVKTKRNKFNDIIVSWQGCFEGGETFNATGELFYCSEQFTYLLKKGFDLFQLIYYNLALDKTKL